jgi:hypothetical protein
LCALSLTLSPTSGSIYAEHNVSIINCNKFFKPKRGLEVAGLVRGKEASVLSCRGCHVGKEGRIDYGTSPYLCPPD